MQLRDDARTYGVLSMVNHWVLAFGMIFLLGSGLMIAQILEGDARMPMLWWHKGLGFLAIFWGVWTVVSHVFQPVRPEADPTYKPFERVARRAMHWVLIGGTLVLGISGTMMSLFNGRPIDVMGLFTIPGLSEVPWIAGTSAFVHQWVGYLIVAAVLAHIAAALKHHFVNQDATLARMMGRQHA
ncbi:MAG: cytochrome b [Pseudomonadota bacterium]